MSKIKKALTSTTAYSIYGAAAVVAIGTAITITSVRSYDKGYTGGPVKDSINTFTKAAEDLVTEKFKPTI